jgi:DNA-binding transcriptional LysR family regulator
MQDDLRDLAAFVAVARERNFRRAAVELRMSASSLSQRMRDLEERLGVRLLNRTTRSVAPTEAGERLLQRLAPALKDVVDATLDIRNMRDVPSGRLRINGPEPALRLVLAPMVAPFLKRYPEIDLEIVADSSLIDIVSEGFDAGIRYEETLPRPTRALRAGGGAELPQRPQATRAPKRVAGPAVHRDALPQRRATAVGIQEGEARGQDHADGTADGSTPGTAVAGRDRRPRFPHDARGLRASRHRVRPSRRSARRLAAKVPRPVPVLPGAAAAAAEPDRVRRFRERVENAA